MNDSVNSESSTKAGKSRTAILAAAEQLFARTGYAATRLEDVAEVVGLTRAALFYYFRDKETLYNAMLENAFGALTKHLDEALSEPGSIAKRIEHAVEAWVDAMVARPTIARLILRHVADAEERPTQPIYPSSDQLIQKYWALFEEGCASGELKPLHTSPFHAASAVIGHTVFYVSALASIIPTGDFKSFAPEEIDAHKKDAVRTVQTQLGITSGKRVRKLKSEPAPKPKTSKRSTRK